MKVPADIDNCKEMVDIVTSNLDISEEEIESILGRVFIESSEPDEVRIGVERYIDILTTKAYREAIIRDKRRSEYDTKQKVDELRGKKGGILNNEYPDTDPDKWKAECENRYCRFDYHLTDSKVDEVICPVCNRELWISPA